MFRIRYMKTRYSNYLPLPDNICAYVVCACITPQEGLTALMMAVKKGLIAIVNTLVEGHADINIQENVSPAVESCGLYTARLIGRHQPFYICTCCVNTLQH